MGCHTWFYKKINVSYEEAEASLLKMLNDEISRVTRWLNNPTKKDMEFLSNYPEITEDFMRWDIELCNRMIRKILKGNCKEAVMNRYRSTVPYIVTYIKGKGHFATVKGYHDFFRIGGYPNDCLFSLEETLQFIENNKNKIDAYTDNYEEKLKSFWKKYPDGMINFG